MTRLTRRASLLVALNLLTSAATSYAECAWGLWQQQGEASLNDQFFDWSWKRHGRYSTESECRKWAARVDSKLGPKGADGYSTVVPVDGRKVRVMNVCLPDTVDPRGAKGK